MNPPAPTSIHYRRRWYYVLWAGLLLVAAALLAWWETPARFGQGTLLVTLEAGGLPEGTRAALWVGRTRDWPPPWPAAGEFLGASDGRISFPPRAIPVAARRLGQGLILRRTHDLALIRFEAPGGQRRALLMDLRDDLQHGLLAPGRRLGVTFQLAWERLPQMPQLPGEERRTFVGH